MPRRTGIVRGWSSRNRNEKKLTGSFGWFLDFPTGRTETKIDPNPLDDEGPRNCAKAIEPAIGMFGRCKMLDVKFEPLSFNGTVGRLSD